MRARSIEGLSVKPGRLVMTAALLAMAGIANAAEEPQTRPMDAEELSAMVRAIAQAPSVSVEHTFMQREPVGFPTRRPCFYARKHDPWTADLDSTWAARFRDALGLADTAAFHALPGSCGSDTTRTDQIVLRFPYGESRIEANVSLDRGYVRFRRSRAYAPPLALRDRAAAVQRLLADALPEDSTLRTLRVCGSPSAGRQVAPPGPLWDDAKPQPLQMVKPTYPKEALALELEGRVVLQALIGKDGRVHSTLILESIPQLDAEAVNAVEQSTFRPARVEGRPVEAWIVMPMRFSIH